MVLRRALSSGVALKDSQIFWMVLLYVKSSREQEFRYLSVNSGYLT